MRDSVINLITFTQGVDEYGVQRAAETFTTVFCRVDSVSQSEWFEGGRNGLNPDYRFTVFGGDYSGEDTVDFEGKRYAVYRTYQNGDYMELYTERKEGQ